MTYDLADIARKLRMNHETIAHRILADAFLQAYGEIDRQAQWINDLQAGMYVNCVYCGHRYGPEDQVPVTMADALKEHIAQCPKHPMAAQREKLAAWMIANGLPTGHGDTFEDLLAEAAGGIKTWRERTANAVECMRKSNEALAMVRECVETVGPPGCVMAAEYVGPEPEHEAQAIINGILLAIPQPEAPGT